MKWVPFAPAAAATSSLLPLPAVQARQEAAVGDHPMQAVAD
jgi:hypothetical protein